MIKLGQKVRDVVSGFEGIAIARTEWMNRCVRITVAPKVKADGTVPDNATFDQEQIEVVEQSPIELPSNQDGVRGFVERRRTGGDRPDPAARVDPR